jgi:EAL domain-containing protein (putative c-di-GMP-specific phosphodiesterase class I)
VLETAAIADIDLAVSILQGCRELGVHFALDDFGTGYSSLTYLRKLPIDTLKIDQSFVRTMLADSEDLGIVEGVIRLAKAFNREVIAEGVETLEHGSALLKLGCHQAQGYGIARPMPAHEFIPWSEQWQRDQLWLEL